MIVTRRTVPDRAERQFLVEAVVLRCRRERLEEVSEAVPGHVERRARVRVRLAARHQLNVSDADRV